MDVSFLDRFNLQVALPPNLIDGLQNLLITPLICFILDKTKVKKASCNQKRLFGGESPKFWQLMDVLNGLRRGFEVCYVELSWQWECFHVRGLGIQQGAKLCPQLPTYTLNMAISAFTREPAMRGRSCQHMGRSVKCVTGHGKAAHLRRRAAGGAGNMVAEWSNMLKYTKHSKHWMYRHQPQMVMTAPHSQTKPHKCHTAGMLSYHTLYTTLWLKYRQLDWLQYHSLETEAPEQYDISSKV